MRRRYALWLLLAACAAAHARPAPETLHEWPAGLPTGEEMEAAGAVIGEIHVIVGDIFDPSIPAEDKWLYRTANKLHINTRSSTVRQQLLFEPGQPYVQRVVDESERILRANEYLYDAWIQPVSYDGRTVNLEVHTRDTWTLNPGLNFSRQGGANTTSIQLEEKNLLGRGQQLAFSWNDDVDRESLTLQFYDPHFRATWTQVGVVYSDADDGSTKGIRINRPFYALDTRHAGGLNLYDSIRNDPRYAYGEQVGEFEQDEQFAEAYYGWSRGWQDGWVRRWTAGTTFSRSRYAVVPGSELGGPLPEDIELVYPWIGFDLVEDAYRERRNQDQIERTEDVLVGVRAGARIGYAAEGFGSDREALLLRAYAQNGWEYARNRSLFLTATGSGRVEDDGLRNAVISAEARFYAQTSTRTKFFATVNGTATESLDADQQLLLGGEEGLRGYPLRYQAGTSRALLTLEQRYYTDWYPFRLFHVAGAAFFDMGRTWGTDITGATSDGLLKDVGVGLRLGSSRSAFGNVIHVDLAFPLDGGDDIDQVQFVVETKVRF